MQLEGEWLAFIELEIVDVGLRRDLQMLAIDDFLKRFLNQRFDDLLADRVLEALLHELRRRLAGTETRELSALLKRADHTLGLAGHSFQRDGDFERMPATID